MNNYTIVHYGEMRLKGRNRYKFEDKLITNIKKICGGKVDKLSSSLLCKNSDLQKFRYISGISWYAPCIKLNKNFDELIKYFKAKNKSLFHDNKTFAIRVRRSDKSYEYDSNQIANVIGDLIRTQNNIKVNLKNPDIEVFIEVNEYILVYFERIKGIGGFPAGIHGKVLCLLSGGIDSPVAAYLMIRKGCHVDLIHFHAFTENEKVIESKISKVVGIINKYQSGSRLYVVPSYPLDLNIFGKNDIAGYEMLLFRKFIYLAAAKIAMKYNYKALVSGDSLGQVASQTIENLAVMLSESNIPIFQPLIAFDKQEIIDISKDIGMYELSIEDYKDCCSILSGKPVTSADIKVINKLQNSIDMHNIVAKSLGITDCYQY